MKQIFCQRVGWALCALLCMLPTVTHGQAPCAVTVTSDFEAQCVLSDKYLFLDMNERDLIACQGMTCTYTAFTNLAASAIVGMAWEVWGEDSYTTNPDGSITVTWGGGTNGTLGVTVTSVTGYRCFWSKPVTLIGRPTAASLSVPMYSVDASGNKVIRVCQGEPVSFVDQSTAGDEDIAGHYWSSATEHATTPNFTISAVNNNDVVVHRVYNNCGCYDSETYQIVVLAGDRLELDCYGTACEDATVTYHATSPTTCGQYRWYVDGGTIVGGQGTSSVTVVWDDPQNGYGTVALDGSLCGGLACPNLMTRKVPVMHSGIGISGPTAVCVGDAVLYSLPLFGSTGYQWTVTPASGVTEDHSYGPNVLTLVFDQPNTYTVSATYECPFLQCGTLTSQPLTVSVLPPLSITGDERVCLSNQCNLATDPSVPADWTVYDASGVAIHTVTASNQFVYTFPSTGQYHVIAESPSFCKSAPHAVNVLPPPPAPTTADMDPDNPTTACPNSAIRLKGQPSNPNYSLYWTKQCSPADPLQVATGNEVTISYGPTVCSVDVYNYDRLLGCLSAAPLPINIAPFALATYTPPNPVRACPGAEVELKAPNQEGVLYRWSIQNTAQEYASVQGSALESSIRLQLNHLNSGTYNPFTVTLERDYCSGSTVSQTITIDQSLMTGNLSLIPDHDYICAGHSVRIHETHNYTNPYLWRVNEGNAVEKDNPFQTGLTYVGPNRVTAYHSPYHFCSDTNYYYKGSAIVTVCPMPPYSGVVYDPFTGLLSAYPGPCSTCTYSWSLNNTVRSNENNPTIDPTLYGSGLFECTIRDVSCNSRGCSVTVGKDVDPSMLDHDCVDDIVVQVVDYDYCTQRLRLHVTAPTPVTWTVLQGDVGIPTITGLQNEGLEVTVNGSRTFEVGVRYKEYGICHYSTYTFDAPFIPDLTLEKACDKIIVRNRSHYANAGYTFVIKMVDQNNAATTCTTSVASPTVTFNNTYAGTYTFWLMDYNGHAMNCYLGEVTMTTPPNGDLLEIETANEDHQNQTCDNTPIELTAKLTSGNSIVSTHWEFGDNSYLDVSGGSVSHTFKNQMSPYTITAKSKDENGCIYTTTFTINSHNDVMKNGQINQNPQTAGCPYVDFIQLQYGDSQIPSTLGFDNTNWWWSDGNTSGVAHLANHTDDYYAYAVNENYCQGQKMLNVEFLPSPEAVISYENGHFCAGMPIVLHGESGPNPGQFQYGWTVSNGGSTVFTGTSSTVTFTPQQAGSYTVQLTVTGTGTGCAGRDTKTLVVQPTPAAPTLAYGGNRCIGDPPVVLNASVPSGTPTFLWSNGDHGSVAHYFTPGYATARYYDAATGCLSDAGELYIPSAPDFDGMMTGCYERCPQFFVPPYKLDAYGLTRGEEEIDWKWYLNTLLEEDGTGNYTLAPLSLLLPAAGSYQLHVDYNGGACSADSPLLDILESVFCLCDSLDIAFTTTRSIENCRLYCTVQVSVTNSMTRPACLDSIRLMSGVAGVSVNSDFLPTILSAGLSYVFNISFEVTSLMPSVADFRIYLGCPLCYKDFYVKLMPPMSCPPDMGTEMDGLEIEINALLSSAGAGYFDFSADVGPTDNVLAFWSEPPMVFDYLFDGYNLVNGLGMFDVARLSQMAHGGENICFYAIVCKDDMLCKRQYCIKASDLYAMLIDAGLSYGRGKALAAAAEPVLKPNPTTGEFVVEYVGGEVAELVLMDMTGRTVATYVGTEVADMTRLPTGTYIVRIRIAAGDREQVFYKKIVKK